MPRRAALRLRLGMGARGSFSYYRVSTDKQGASGLGLAAQREAVARHVAGAQGTIVAEFQEIESGKKNDRPQIAAALAACRLRRATLVIAKLDRLARNVHFISSLMESGVDFVACDNPHATRLTIHILAAVAEHEREMMSQRTTAALGAPRARGVKLGNPRLKPGARRPTRPARQARTDTAIAHAALVLPYIEAARKAGCVSLGELARALTARGIDTPAGGREWRAAQVSRVLARAHKRIINQQQGRCGAGCRGAQPRSPTARSRHCVRAAVIWSSPPAGGATIAENARSRPCSSTPITSPKTMTEREFNRQIGANIRSARKAAGITQRALAAAIGLWPARMSRMERGEQLIGINRLRWLAGALGVAEVALLPRLVTASGEFN